MHESKSLKDCYCSNGPGGGSWESVKASAETGDSDDVDVLGTRVVRTAVDRRELSKQTSEVKWYHWLGSLEDCTDGQLLDSQHPLSVSRVFQHEATCKKETNSPGHAELWTKREVSHNLRDISRKVMARLCSLLAAALPGLFLSNESLCTLLPERPPPRSWLDICADEGRRLERKMWQTQTCRCQRWICHYDPAAISLETTPCLI